MGVADKMWDAVTTVIKMNDKVERMAGTMKTQQEKIEKLTERVIRLETMLELALVQQSPARQVQRQIDHKEQPESKESKPI